MSGTSLDAIDAVIVDFSSTTPLLELTHSHEIPTTLKAKIIETIHPDWIGSLAQIGELNHQLGQLFADSVNSLIEKSNCSPQEIAAVGSHGQTVWHQPFGENPFSMQLGDANLISEHTGITTIADFRSRDIAAGGQGAPLVPAFHHSLFSHPEKNRGILNIGGIANISFLPSEEDGGQVIGFDTGPGNGLMDAWISRHKSKTYDKYGAWASSGNVIRSVLNTLLSDDYFSMPPPKSTGKEAFNLQWLETKLDDNIHQFKPKDIQATLTELTAQTIADNINENYDELYICGGGIRNEFLMSRIQYHLPNLPITSTIELGVDPEWMEAIAFAWLAKQTAEGKAGNLPTTTGARGDRVLGAIYPK